ncbi:hypothetical protein NL676_020148 [Syzygium grande]|nr:hypothetical protein NL676_020148 [Syzygium grande]
MTARRPSSPRDLEEEEGEPHLFANPLAAWDPLVFKVTECPRRPPRLRKKIFGCVVKSTVQPNGRAGSREARHVVADFVKFGSRAVIRLVEEEHLPPDSAEVRRVSPHWSPCSP